MIKAYNIRWDTDGDKKLLEALPTEVLINDEDLQHYIDPDSDCDAKMDAVSDYLTDTYGYCHKGFDTCILPSEEELNVLDIIDSALALQGYDAVSYTHLDVYKRQTGRCFFIYNSMNVQPGHSKSKGGATLVTLHTHILRKKDLL